jgi:2-phosphosulfolactate phosphatase
MLYDQSEFDIRCEWGEQGVKVLAPISDAIIIVDVMSFSTAVVIATRRGAIVYPYRWKDDSRIDFTKSVGAELAGSRGKSRYSLSPISLMPIPAGTRLVLPSPNGSTLSLTTGNTPTFAGCLRNARAVAKAALRHGPKVSVVPCGERWKEDHSLRPAFEDLIGAGAIISNLSGSLSPEASVAVAAFDRVQEKLLETLKQCTSGKELIQMGFEQDIPPTAEINTDKCAPILKDGAFRPNFIQP